MMYDAAQHYTAGQQQQHQQQQQQYGYHQGPAQVEIKMDEPSYQQVSASSSVPQYQYPISGSALPPQAAAAAAQHTNAYYSPSNNTSYAQTVSVSNPSYAAVGTYNHSNSHSHTGASSSSSFVAATNSTEESNAVNEAKMLFIVGIILNLLGFWMFFLSIAGIVIHVINVSRHGGSNFTEAKLWASRSKTCAIIIVALVLALIVFYVLFIVFTFVLTLAAGILPIILSIVLRAA